jgi:hypothetical protein
MFLFFRFGFRDLFGRMGSSFFRDFTAKRPREGSLPTNYCPKGDQRASSYKDKDPMDERDLGVLRHVAAFQSADMSAHSETAAQRGLRVSYCDF